MSSNDSLMAMVTIAPTLERWFCMMDWTFCTNRCALPFLTSDSPAVLWAHRGRGLEGVGFMDPAMRILVPLTPELCVLASQTERSLKNVTESSPGNEVGGFSSIYEISFRYEDLDLDAIVRFNQVVVANANRYAYAPSDAPNVRAFMSDVFYGRFAPVRRFDGKPIGSPIECDSEEPPA
jgi:hypothetical protein